jgi:hypothetical protein
MSIFRHYITIHSAFKFSYRFGSVRNFEEAKNLVVANHVKAEIIGNWIYCHTNVLIGVQLVALGVWYSYKHDAFVYSGREKDGTADDETLDEIRARLGSRQLQGVIHV